jgi:hypothetical protein
MPARWSISHFPACRFHVFLSHCDEDRGWLAFPLFKRLESLGVMPWLDLHHYPLGTDPFEALREGILRCRHVVYLVTLATLSQGRGWTAIEKAYAGLLQDSLSDNGRELAHVELPLFFLQPNDERLTRSVWGCLRYRGTFAPNSADRVEWAAQQIRRFVTDEQIRALEFSVDLEKDSPFRERIEGRNQPGLIDRICAHYPA